MRAQILLLTVSLVVLAVAALAALTISQIRKQLVEGMEGRAISLTKVMIESVAPGLEFEDSSFVAEIVATSFSDPDVIGACVCDHEDRVVYRATRGQIPESLLESCPYTDTLVVTHRDNSCLVSGGILRGNRRLGDILLVMSEGSTNARIRDSIILIIATSLVALILVAVIGLALSRRIVKPIALFRAAADRLRQGDMDVELDTTTLHRDFVSLGAAFNKMRRSLKMAFAQLRNSKQELEERVVERTSELSHELQERKRAEQALQETGELLRATIESTGDGILVVNNEGRVTHANARFAEMWRIPQELRDSKDDELLLAHVSGQLQEPEKFLARVHELYESAEEDFGSLEFKDGRIFERFSSPLVSDAVITGRVWSFRDVTERVRSEEQRHNLMRELDQARRLESLGILAGGVAHDLNNLLGPLVGYPSLLLETATLDEQSRSYVQAMGEAAGRSASVIQDLLTLARRGRYKMGLLDLNAVVREYLGSPSFHDLSKRKPQVKVETSLCEDQLPMIGSAPHLLKALMNLVGNAFDAISEAGTLQIRTSRLKLEKLLGGYEDINEGEYVTLQVSDNGVGIPERDLSRIFEPYYSRKVMSDRSGTGLGLSVVHGVVKDHGGYYDILSTEGTGTEFVLYFPLTEGEIEVTAGGPATERGAGKILVVDDEPSQRQLANALLQSLGYQVETVSSGRAAVAYLKQNQVDLVLLDMVMEEDFDGLTTYREILRVNPKQKAVIASGFAVTERVEEA
ncbi:MAG: ATP-binding protein, partial [bacterium]